MSQDAMTLVRLQAENAALQERVKLLEQQQTATAAPLAADPRVFEGGPIIVFKWVAAANWPVAYVSANVTQLGYSPDDFYSGDVLFASIVEPADLERVAAEVQGYSEAGVPSFEQEYRMITRDGSVRWMYDYTAVLRDEQGTITHYQGYLMDITERRQRDEQQRVLNTLAENALDGIGIADGNQRITYANAAFQRMSGYGSDLIGLSAIALYAPEAREVLLRDGLPVLQRDGMWQGVLEMVRPDGSHWWSQQSAFVVQDEAGTVIGFANILRDVTEERQREVERAALQQQVIDAQQSVLRELSTPLIPIASDVVIMPLIGTVDSSRAQLVMETLLEGVAQHRAKLAVIDITGVALVDTQVAQALVNAARAVRLLGARVMLTGIQPQIAQTLVHLGVDLSDIDTRGSLQDGITAALRESQAAAR